MSSVCRLAATLAADVVCYSRLMGQDEAGPAAPLSQPQERHARVQLPARITVAMDRRGNCVPSW
jgi:hypothetical protein